MTSGSGDDIIGLPSCEPEDTPEPAKKKPRIAQPGIFAGLTGKALAEARGKLGGAMRAAQMTPDALSRSASIAGKASAAKRAKEREEKIAAGIHVRATPSTWGSRPFPTAKELGRHLDEARKLYPELGEAAVTRKAVQLRRAWLVRTAFEEKARGDE